ncbi:hypothetical protein AV530_013419 [Patagioenas fasciata monilis]|uniref:Uncharacterized protein n=1 Tax=Patagioenas fasciata monilis TaxID=372326 RepID=A0A1V4JPD8_PATFA|nr:hypothetical protein AV530_013419 [Patagioenas fasciata monilis]
MPIRNQGEPHQNGSKHLMAASKNSSCSAGFQSPDAEFTLLVPRSGSGRGFKRKCQNLIRERLLCFCSPRRPGKVIKTAACPCRRLRGGGSRQDGKVHRKKEKCKRAITLRLWRKNLCSSGCGSNILMDQSPSPC